MLSFVLRNECRSATIRLQYVRCRSGHASSASGVSVYELHKGFTRFAFGEAGRLAWTTPTGAIWKKSASRRRLWAQRIFVKLYREGYGSNFRAKRRRTAQPDSYVTNLVDTPGVGNECRRGARG